MMILPSRTRTNTSSPISIPATASSSSWRFTWTLWYSPSSSLAPLGLSFFLRTIAVVLVALRHSRHISVVYPSRCPVGERERCRCPLFRLDHTRAYPPVRRRVRVSNAGRRVETDSLRRVVYKCFHYQLSFPRYIYYTLCADLSWSKIMVREDGKRNFALRKEDGSEPSEFSGNMPRQAALKAARTLDPAPSEAEAERTTLRLREKGTRKVHEYEGWAWKDSAPEVDEADDEFWLNDLDDITKANVSKQGIEYLDEE